MTNALRRLLSFLRIQVLPLAVMVLVLLSFRSAVADWYDVPTGSMIPTIRIGDRIMVDNRAFGLRVPFTHTWVARWAEPQVGDIVTCRSPADGVRLVKRVCAGPGDTVSMQDNRLVVNGRELDYEPLDIGDFAEDLPAAPTEHRAFVEGLTGHEHVVLFTPGRGAPRDFGPVEVPEGHYLLMGDNRDMSADSRVFGFVRATEITGRAERVAFSVDRSDGFRLRGDRFLARLD